ncbi:MAG TPA: sialidase family protein [Candidatus Binatia bacterium]|nr:sialidase family protein [Candidatus Binatia bacterium]
MTSSHSCSCHGVSRIGLVLALGVALVLFGTLPGNAQSLFRQISQDSFTNPSSQHMTEVEPGGASWGPVIVTAFQVGRIYSGGGADIGWATSLNGGIAWTNGYLPGITQFQGGGPNSGASDAAVAYNARFGEWLICTLPIGNSYDTVAVSRSADGIHWDNPIYVITNQDADKNWITCDNTATSPYYGNCYVEWDNPDFGDLLYMSTSTDGGLTWGSPKTTGGTDYGIGGNPVVLPNGNVVVPFADFDGGMSAFMSTNGGQSWTAAISIANAPSHGEAGGLRSAGLPSVAIDGGGTVYTSWSDCSFESGCSANDIVYSSSTDGIHWTAKTRIPMDPIGSGVDHFINGMGIDSRTSGSSAHMAMTYYYYPVSNCGSSCQLTAGFTITTNGGQTWTAARQLGPPMQLSWLPQTFSGRMVADYVTTVFDFGRAFPIYAQAFQPVNGLFQEAMFTSSFGYSQDEMTEPLMSSAGEKPIPGIKSDHPARTRGEVDNLPPNRRQGVPPRERD